MNIFAPTFAKRLLFFLIADFFLFFLSLHFAYNLRFDFEIPSEHLANFYIVFFTLALLKLGMFYLWGIYRLTWRFFSLQDAKTLFYAHISALGVFTAFFTLFPDLFFPMPRSAIAIDLILSFILTGTLRLSKRILLESTRPQNHTPALIVGISPNTASLIKNAMEGSIGYYPSAVVAIREHNRNMAGSTIQNVSVIDADAISKWTKTHAVTAAIIDATLEGDDLKSAYQRLTDAGITDIKRSALLSDGRETITSLSVEELLARRPKDLDTETIGQFIRGKTVLITGAGGSIGSEIALQCDRFGAKRLILLDNSEYNLYQIGEKLPNASLHLCNILDGERIGTILKEFSPDLLIHAAAYKHVPLCEANPHAAIENNVIGSRTLIDVAIAHHVPKIVIISTDKAVRPTNVMGATKRIVELYAQNVDPHESEIVSVRFGNVLGSSGSVIPKFKTQIEAGGPITITHPDITRYFMLISEACQLVLQAAAIARGGELFILDMGESVKIIDLARTMIRLYTSRPIEIVITGLRPGEKLYEELLIDESEQKTSYESILIARSTPFDINALNARIDALSDAPNVRNALNRIVPEYTPSAASL